MFRRRKDLHIAEKIRHFLWPKTGWSRAWQYIGHRTIRIKASPHSIAFGFAMGVLASFTPFLGLHTAIAVALCWPFGGSFIAAFFGTFVGNPLTFPFIWVTTYRLGSWFFGGPAYRNPELTGPIWDHSFERLWPLIKPMTAGGVPLGILAALVAYFPIRYIVAAYQQRRAERRAVRARRKTQGDPA